MWKQKEKMRLELLILFIFLLFSSIAQQCSFNKMSPLSDVMSCLSRIPFKENVRQKTVKYVKKMLEFYVYKDIVVNS